MIYTMINKKLAQIYEAHRFNYIYKKVLGNKQLNSIYARFQRINLIKSRFNRSAEHIYKMEIKVHYVHIKH